MEPSNKQVYRWFIEELTGDLSPADEAALREALSSNPSVRALWDSLEKEAKGLDIPVFIRRLDAQTGLESLKTQLEARPHGRVKRLSTFRKAGVAAATLFILLTGAYFAWFRNPSIVNKEKISALIQKKRPSVKLQLGDGRSVDLDKGPTGQSGQTIRLHNATLNTNGDSLRYASGDTTPNVLSVPAGGKYAIVLFDGTRVLLNAATTLRFPFNFPAQSREVYLEGEAYFQIAPDAHRPFIVHTSLTQIRVLGTSFDVNTYTEGKVRTALVEGKVLAKNKDGRTVALTPGNAADYDAANGFITGKFDVDDELSWLNGVYYFHDMPIADLGRLASRCFGVHIIIDKDRLAGKSVTGLLDTGKLLEFLKDLETTAHINCRYAGNDLYFE